MSSAVENLKVTVVWTDGTCIGSSDALGFGNSKVWTSVASTPNDLTLKSVVHPTPSFKSCKDAPRFLLQHQMNWRFSKTPADHPTSVFEVYSDAPSGWPSAPDKLMRHQIIVSVHCLVQRLYWSLLVTGWSDACAGEPSVHPTVQLFRGHFLTASHPC
jgi:hypothetical protein